MLNNNCDKMENLFVMENTEFFDRKFSFIIIKK